MQFFFNQHTTQSNEHTVDPQVGEDKMIIDKEMGVGRLGRSGQLPGAEMYPATVVPVGRLSTTAVIGLLA
ncbi:unnamed protein product [Pleuronectes platessa]|uniref:Uncharacterized protein n=1 Tax=Pleuronectes platessa TaxID=8262 RepID=A0A9N7UXY2_PLEPL|nr:unnamed protein product [Pleuronectes platessa]